MLEVLLTLAFVLVSAVLWWFLLGRLLFPISIGMELHLFVAGDAPALEQSVRALIWLRGLGLLSCPIVIVDGGLSPTGHKIARAIVARWMGISILTHDMHQ